MPAGMTLRENGEGGRNKGADRPQDKSPARSAEMLFLRCSRQRKNKEPPTREASQLPRSTHQPDDRLKPSELPLQNGAGEAGGTPSARFSRASADLLARSCPPTRLRTCGWLCRRSPGDLACARHPQGPYWRPVSRPRMDPRPSDPGAPAETPDFSPRRAKRGMRPCGRMEMVDPIGIEPMTSCLQGRCSTN